MDFRYLSKSTFKIKICSSQMYLIVLYFNSCRNRFVNPQPELKVDDTYLNTSEMVSFLGLKVNQFLDWNNQIDYLILVFTYVD
jgi:hypothetical protein